MKKIYILLLFTISLSAVFGQVTLNFRNNGMIPGDSSRTQEISYVDSGNPGENQVWDFSGIQYTGKTTFSGIAEDQTLKTTGTGEKSLVVSEDGYDYNYLLGESGCTETGYANLSKKMTLGYTDPIVKMKYPLSFGQQYSDPFAGVAWYCEKSRVDLSGVYTVHADAFGTLILPGHILKNVLRVKSVKQSLQVNTCGSTQMTLTKYSWYAPGYRYPVMMVSTSESRYGAKDPVIVKTAWVSLNQQQGGALATSAGSASQVNAGENSVVVYPNPFTEQATYTYFLQKQVPVTVEMYDMSGKLNVWIEKKQVQAEGLHTGNFNATYLGLLPGVYYLRFTLDKQVVVTKIVKI
jgi:hypothetical protein